MIYSTISFTMAAQRNVSLDPDGPLPLYHQIAVALRYRIATGELAPGDRLPPLREGARRWDVNYHTVRQAYEVLAEAGLVAMRRGAGSTVASGPREASVTSEKELSGFLDHVRSEARRRFGVTPAELSRLVRGGAPEASSTGARPSGAAGSPSCTVVECNVYQCADLASQLRGRFDVEVREWILGTEGEPAPGPLVGTYFHFGEMRRRWPERWTDMHFPALHPDPALRERIAALVAGGGGSGVPLLEREGTLAEAMAADVGRLLAPLAVEPRLTSDPSRIGHRTIEGPMLVAPRVWNDLPEALREDPRLIELRYVFRDHDLAALASSLGWRRNRSRLPTRKEATAHG